MKVLFVTTNDISQSFGGAIGSRRNYDMLTELYGSENVDYILLKELPSLTLKQKVKKTIIKYIYNTQFDMTPLKNIDFSQYEIVFNDNSVIGNFLVTLRSKSYKGKIISYFHNCEHSLYHQMYASKAWYIREPLFKLVSKNESNTLRYSDMCIILNNRDLNDIKSVYGGNFNYTIIPVSMRDFFNISRVQEELQHKKRIFTFIGSYFGPNVQGIIWFIKNVLPHVDIKLRIIGRGMEKLSSDVFIDPLKIELLSDVVDISHYVYDSDCMIYPIKDGSGMKLKTCEALMFGRNIIGSTESFMGYDIDDYNKIGACCNTAEEYIQAINTFSRSSFNEYSRELYVKKYSYIASLNSFKKIVSN